MSKAKTTFTVAERRGYWMGVGISNAVHDQRDLLDHPDPRIRASVQAGYEANNRSDVSHKAFSVRGTSKKSGGSSGF